MSQFPATRGRVPQVYWEFAKSYEKNSSGNSVLKIHRGQYPTPEVIHFRDYGFNLVAYHYNWRIAQPEFDYLSSSWAIDTIGKSKTSKVYLDASLEDFLEQWVGLQTTQCFPGTPRATPFINTNELVEADKHRLYFEITFSESPDVSWDVIVATFLSKLESMMIRYVPGFTWRNNCDMYTLSSPSQSVMSFHVICPFVYVTRSQNHHLATLLASSNRSLVTTIYNDSQPVRLLGTSDRCNIQYQGLSQRDQGLPQYDHHLRRKRLSYQCNYVAATLAVNASFKDTVTSDYYRGIFQGNPTRDGINLTELYTHSRELVKEICRFSLIGLCVVYPNSVDLTCVDFGEKKRVKYSRAGKHFTPLPHQVTSLLSMTSPAQSSSPPPVPLPLPRMSLPKLVAPNYEEFYHRYPTPESVLKCPTYGSKMMLFRQYILSAICGTVYDAYKLLLGSVANVLLDNPRCGKLFVLHGGPKEERDAFLGFLGRFYTSCNIDYNSLTRSEVLPSEVMGRNMVVLTDASSRDKRKMKIRRSNLTRFIREDAVGISDERGEVRSYRNDLNFFVSEDLNTEFDFDTDDANIVVMRCCYTQLDVNKEVIPSSVPRVEEPNTRILHNVVREFYSGDETLLTVFSTYLRRYYEKYIGDVNTIRCFPKINADMQTDKRLFKRMAWDWISALVLDKPYFWRSGSYPILCCRKENEYFGDVNTLYGEFQLWSVGKINILHAKGIRYFKRVVHRGDIRRKEHLRFWVYDGESRYVTYDGDNPNDERKRHTGFAFHCDYPLEKAM